MGGWGQLADCHYHIGLACANSNSHSEAVDAFNQAIALLPDMTPYLHERAKSLQRVGRYKVSSSPHFVTPAPHAFRPAAVWTEIIYQSRTWPPHLLSLGSNEAGGA